MDVIVDKIKLKPGVAPSQFEDWVTGTDYAACSDLPSVMRFSVHKVSDAADAPYHYFEVVEVTSMADFERDMGSDVFKGLVEAFEKMADVVETLSGNRLEPGFAR